MLNLASRWLTSCGNVCFGKIYVLLVRIVVSTGIAFLKSTSKQCTCIFTFKIETRENKVSGSEALHRKYCYCPEFLNVRIHKVQNMNTIKWLYICVNIMITTWSGLGVSGYLTKPIFLWNSLKTSDYYTGFNCLLSQIKVLHDLQLLTQLHCH